MVQSAEDAHAQAVGTGNLETLVAKWLGHFDVLSAAGVPNCSIYWECASDLLTMIRHNEA